MGNARSAWYRPATYQSGFARLPWIGLRAALAIVTLVLLVFVAAGEKEPVCSKLFAPGLCRTRTGTCPESDFDRLSRRWLHLSSRNNASDISVARCSRDLMEHRHFFRRSHRSDSCGIERRAHAARSASIRIAFRTRMLCRNLLRSKQRRGHGSRTPRHGQRYRRTRQTRRQP